MNPDIESIRSDSDEHADEDADGAQLLLDGWREGFGEPRCTDDDYCIVAELSLKSTPFCIQRDKTRALYVYLDNIRGTRPFDVDENWLEFRRRLGEIPGVSLWILVSSAYSFLKSVHFQDVPS
jgi:hypothetical protein